jgi:hypothetical protein
MMARPTVFGGSVTERQAGPGDILVTGESFIAGPSADANSTLTAAMIVAGVLNRTGMTAGRTDTTDTATTYSLHSLATIRSEHSFREMHVPIQVCSEPSIRNYVGAWSWMGCWNWRY